MSSRRGFTLIELLVVIAVIALLVAILVPSLKRAKDLAVRAICLTNLRECARVLYYYADENGAKVPLGYHNAKEWNRNFHYGGNGTATYTPFWMGQGSLWVAGVLQDVAILYCPAESDPRYQYDSPTNPWPLRNPDDYVYSSYGIRPVVNQLAGQHGLWSGPMPRLTDFYAKALYADPTGLTSWVDRRHNDGVNAGYADGAANWVPREAIDDDLALATHIGWDYGNGPQSANQDRIWETMDRH